MASRRERKKKEGKGDDFYSWMSVRLLDVSYLESA